MSFRNSKTSVDIGPQIDRPVNPGFDGLIYVSETAITAWDATAGVWRNAGGGGGINQLTGDVTAGPGSGSQVATVVGLAGTPLNATPPTPGQTLVFNGVQWVPSTSGGASGPALAIAYFDALGNLTGNPLLTPLGTSYGRPQIHDTRQQFPGPLGPNVVWRQGALSSDGDSSDIEGDGIVIYGPGPDGNMSGSNYMFARVKSNRFAIRASVLGNDIGYAWRVDDTHQFFTNDAGFQTMEIIRDTGSATFKDKLGNDFVVWDGGTTPTRRTFKIMRNGFPVFLVETDGVTRQVSMKDETGANVLLIEELPVGAKITAYKPFRPGSYTLAAANALTIQQGKNDGFMVWITDAQTSLGGQGVMAVWNNFGPAGSGYYPMSDSIGGPAAIVT